MWSNNPLKLRALLLVFSPIMRAFLGRVRSVCQTMQRGRAS